jgi:phage shock protein PspC (stress-responsive transcriptional regulator)
MGLAEDLARLAQLHASGELSDDEYARAKARLIDAAPPPPPSLRPSPPPGIAALGALRRSRGERWLGGVCGGLARATGVEALIWRLLFALLTFFGGAGALVYLLLWLVVPLED